VIIYKNGKLENNIPNFDKLNPSIPIPSLLRNCEIVKNYLKLKIK
jgi:hypothetical protein